MIDPEKIKQDPGESPQNEIQLEDEWLEGAEHATCKTTPPPDGIDEEHLVM